jgi:hypothetical protein
VTDPNLKMHFWQGVKIEITKAAAIAARLETLI